MAILEQHRMIDHPSKQPFLRDNSYFGAILVKCVHYCYSECTDATFLLRSRELAFTAHQVLKTT